MHRDRRVSLIYSYRRTIANWVPEHNSRQTAYAATTNRSCFRARVIAKAKTVDTLMWGSDYPHTESTFPQSHKILERILDGVPEGERQKIVRDNAARLYGFEIG